MDIKQGSCASTMTCPSRGHRHFFQKGNKDPVKEPNPSGIRVAAWDDDGEI